MQLDFPKDLTGQTREDLDKIWEDVWKIVEYLRLLEEELARKDEALTAAGVKLKQIEAAGGSGGSVHRIPFGQVTSNDTLLFTATVPGVVKLEDGVAAYIMNNNSKTSATGWTLNVNGLGAKPVYQTMAVSSQSTSQFNKGYTMLFVYNSKRVAGGCWDMFYGYYSDTQTAAYNIRRYVSRRVKNNYLYKYKVCFSNNEGKLVPSCLTDDDGTLTNKTLNTEPFSPFGEIFYYTGTAQKNAGDVPSASNMYSQYSAANLGYGFNMGTSLTTYAPVYVRCTPQADGQAVLDGNDCITQALPNTADGKVYIHLGYAAGSKTIDMSQVKPVYQYKDGKIQLWTGA